MLALHVRATVRGGPQRPVKLLNPMTQQNDFQEILKSKEMRHLQRFFSDFVLKDRMVRF